jgi:hypothetical protein
MFGVRVLLAGLVLSVAASAAAQVFELPRPVAPTPPMSGPAIAPGVPTLVVPPPPPSLPSTPDIHAHVPQQCCHDVCTPDFSCPAGQVCAQRCTNVCTQC